jgi:hypothetical protein
MCRPFALCLLTLAGLAAWASPSSAQIVIRAPFVQVQVGGGVSVQAPFVNINTMPAYPGYCAPPVIIVPAKQVRTPERAPAPASSASPADTSAPEPVTAPRPMTLGAFANTFKPREGSYEIVLLNPVTSAPTTVQFSLPAGTPRSIRVLRRELEFVYDGGQWVRIRFDRLGARVISRL